MNKQSPPYNAQEWSEFLATQTLPTGPLIGNQVLQIIKNDNLPYSKIAALANKDPVFSYHVLSKANKNKEDDSPFSKTLEHAISMLGTDQLSELISTLPIHKPTAGSTQQLYYARAVSSSLFASYIAQAISASKNSSQSKDIYWGALLCGVPMWFLWEYATPQMKKVRSILRHEFKTPQQAETEVFGCSLPDLSAELVKKLCLPPLTKACYLPENQLTPKQWIKISQHVNQDGRPLKVDDKYIKHTLSKPSFTITLANLLAYYASQDWYSNATLRVQKIISVYLSIPLNQAVSMTHDCAIKMSREHPIPGIMLPAAKLLLPPRPRLEKIKTTIQEETPSAATSTETEQDSNAPPVSAPQASPSSPVSDNSQTIAPELTPTNPEPTDKEPTQEEEMQNLPAEPTPGGDKEIFNEFTHLMLKEPDNFVDLHELMNAAAQCMSYGIGLQKAMIALVNTNKTRLKAYYSIGTKNHPALSNFQEDLTKPSLLSRLTEKPSSIWVKTTSNQSIWAMVPPELKVASGAKEFFLMSIFINQKPVAIFYADTGQEGQALTEENYKQFKYMCGAATHCLQHLAEKRAKES